MQTAGLLLRGALCRRCYRRVGEQIGAGFGHSPAGLAAGERCPAALGDEVVLLPAVGRLKLDQSCWSIGRLLEFVCADRCECHDDGLVNVFGASLLRPALQLPAAEAKAEDKREGHTSRQAL